MKNAHIITCLDLVEYSRFITEGFAGLNPITVSADNIENDRSLSAKIGTNWDIIADLKRVKVGDYIFLHIRGEGNIYGAFEATSEFMESPEMPACFKSRNLNIGFWRENYVDVEFDDYPWKVGIKSIDGITKKNGFNAMELFKLKSIGIIQSLPERFMYHDKPKIVKPLLINETAKIIELLANTQASDFLNVEAEDLTDFIKINLNLEEYNGELFREKILEAWIMENVTFNGDNLLAHQNFVSVFGNIQHFSNSIFTYYANFLDVLLYNENIENLENEYCLECNKYTSKNKNDIWIIELKKGWANDEVEWQLREYGDWAKKALANNDDEKLNLCIIATGFSQELQEQTIIKLVKYRLINEAPFLVLEKLNF